MLGYTYVLSPGKESTFQWEQIQTPKWLFHFYLFSACSLHNYFHDLYGVFRFVNPLTPGPFYLNAFPGHFGDFQDIGQSSFNLVKKASATWQRAFLPLASPFTTFWLRHASQNFEMRKWPTSFQVKLSVFFNFFFVFPHFFSFRCSDRPCS